jgi:hypothetical protein
MRFLSPECLALGLKGPFLLSISDHLHCKSLAHLFGMSPLLLPRRPLCFYHPPPHPI